ncbi:hypothetical protein EZS27_025265 [termite gut metagenome]|uniref:Uncharacterized protein n=1 Tax=termite gut metagenome TaxID=433724 RepID=A0A5J4QWG3_9ZZZZ
MLQKLDLDRTLNKNNIDENIQTYISLLKEIDINISCSNLSVFLNKLKRDPIGKGPYKDVSLFEASNRIMTDLVILSGVKELLEGKHKDICFTEYIVEYGNENKNKHDIIVKENEEIVLKGEAFNVAESFFKNKKRSSLKKLKETENKDIKLILLYNEEVTKQNEPEKQGNVYYIKVNIDEVLSGI